MSALRGLLNRCCETLQRHRCRRLKWEGPSTDLEVDDRERAACCIKTFCLKTLICDRLSWIVLHSPPQHSSPRCTQVHVHPCPGREVCYEKKTWAGSLGSLFNFSRHQMAVLCAYFVSQPSLNPNTQNLCRGSLLDVQNISLSRGILSS